MKTRYFFTLLSLIMAVLSLQCMFVEALQAQEPKGTITIENIEQDQEITGTVAELTNLQNYRVLVYVHAPGDIWYIHPYAKGGEGKSWAAIKLEDKKWVWSLETVKRQADSDGVAALIVDPAVANNPPGQIKDEGELKQIQNHGMIVYTEQQMKDEKWHGKL